MTPTTGEFRQIYATAQAMNCACRGRCKPAEALDCLYRRALDVLSRPEGTQGAGHSLLQPLSVVVGQQKTQAGQRACAQFAAMLSAGDSAGAIDICRRLIDPDAN
ncbi:hypothetical protein EOE18_09990 [Novosphingobium umbonatum]|uniref:Uncharacterized protein n=1 Tax=Novosphingobium umbonatum TaxID=1908524 RepID=A0A437N550_9SPHN|nr:hypothetical protein [Novosphingobium umbonatum]RVU05054.1 hypothetical protein EOE18_09990 [Novosphingobium umbonatum]